MNAVRFSQMDYFEDEDYSSSTWTFIVQVAVQSQTSVEGVTARDFVLETEVPMYFKKTYWYNH